MEGVLHKKNTTAAIHLAFYEVAAVVSSIFIPSAAKPYGPANP
jgi:hypothetical protein